MTTFLDRILGLLTLGKVRVSEHGYVELSEEGLSAGEVVAGLVDGTLIEEYPDFAKGHCALFLQLDSSGNPVHVVWGIPKGYDEPLVLVTAYRPDPDRWEQTYRRRLKK